jgi:NTE family protein
MLSRPDILVLGGGGVLGRAWMTGVLAGIEDVTGFEMSRCEYFVGTSAGSVISAQLVAGVPLERPATASTDLATTAPGDVASAHGDANGATAAEIARRAGDWALATTSPWAPLALRVGRPGGALVRSVLLRAGTVTRADGDHGALRAEVDGWDASFDGRLRATAVERRTGHRVVFGSPGAPFATVGEAVEASCAIPGVYPPMVIGGRAYVDGGVWSPSNLDAAPAYRGTQVLCLNPLSTAPANASSVVRGFARSALTLEAMALRGRGAAVASVAPDPASIAAIGPELSDRRPRADVLAAGYLQGESFALQAGRVRAR